MRNIDEIEKRYEEKRRLGTRTILKKRYIIVVILLIAFFTNPNEEKHKAVILSKVIHTVAIVHTDDFVSQDTRLEMMVDRYISSSNYIFFSTTNIMWEGKKGIIGIGIFGKVFVFDIADDILKEKIR